MTATFSQADCLAHLESLCVADATLTEVALPAWLVQALPHESADISPPVIIHALIQLLMAKKAMWQAAIDTGLIADELRRYQKFAKPGQPSAHIVRLRQQQAAARVASSQSRQSFIKAAAAFVRVAGVEVPPRVTLEAFVTSWIDTRVPRAFIHTP